MTFLFLQNFIYNTDKGGFDEERSTLVRATKSRAALPRGMSRLVGEATPRSKNARQPAKKSPALRQQERIKVK